MDTQSNQNAIKSGEVLKSEAEGETSKSESVKIEVAPPSVEPFNAQECIPSTWRFYSTDEEDVVDAVNAETGRQLLGIEITTFNKLLRGK